MEQSRKWSSRLITLTPTFHPLITHLFAYDCVNFCAITNVRLAHYKWPLLFPEDHESVEWFLHIRPVIIQLGAR